MSLQKTSQTTSSGSHKTAMALYSKINDPMDAVNKLGLAFAKSGMFGCANVEQGQVLALTCLTEGITPLEFQRRYHIISGKPSLRADYMLAEFTKQGGDYTVIERSSERAAIELKVGKRKGVFEFTIAEAANEEYVYTKPANDGKIPKFIDGKINNAACKDNWSTPRRRAQMLWNRIVSDGIRTICPTVNHGGYTPDELGGDDMECETEAVVAQANPVDGGTKKVKPAAESKGELKDDPLGEPIDAEFEIVEDDSQAKNEKAKDSEPPFKSEPTYDRDSLLVRLKAVKESLGLSAEQYRGILAKRGVTSAKDLSDSELASLVSACEQKLEAIEKKKEAEEYVDKTLGK